MSTKPLAEVFEELKELRRRGEVPDSSVAAALESAAAVRVDMETSADSNGIRAGVEQIARTLGVWALAERVFGTEAKATAWLNRPNTAMAGQRPTDLIQDELGAAVVREALEQIDHGIFA